MALIEDNVCARQRTSLIYARLNTGVHKSVNMAVEVGPVLFRFMISKQRFRKVAHNGCICHLKYFSLKITDTVCVCSIWLHMFREANLKLVKILFMKVACALQIKVHTCDEICCKLLTTKG